MTPTPKDSTIRLALYVLISMVTTASGAILAVDFSDPKQVALLILAIAAAGLNTARSYIDQTPTQVKQ